jgi:hypothetical protein
MWYRMLTSHILCSYIIDVRGSMMAEIKDICFAAESTNNNNIRRDYRLKLVAQKKRRDRIIKRKTKKQNKSLIMRE